LASSNCWGEGPIPFIPSIILRCISIGSVAWAGAAGFCSWHPTNPKDTPANTTKLHQRFICKLSEILD
jgi:hypothetical protein